MSPFFMPAGLLTSSRVFDTIFRINLPKIRGIPQTRFPNPKSHHSILFDHKTVRFACHATLPKTQGFGEELHAQHAVQEQANNQTGAEPVPLLGCRELTTTKIPKIVTKPKY